MISRATFQLLLLLSVYLALGHAPAAAAAQTAQEEETSHTITLGETWEVLAWRYDVTPQALLAMSGAVNPHRQPAIGSSLILPQTPERHGRFLRPFSGGLLETAARNGRNPWTIAAQNDLDNPFRPLLYSPLFLPGGRHAPREFPPGVNDLTIAPAQIYPGAALALRAQSPGQDALNIALERQPLLVSRQDDNIVALGGTGAFFAPGQHLLTVHAADKPLWEQPLTFIERDWNWEQVTFTNTAVMDPEAIRLERERLQTLWDTVTFAPYWQGAFQMPISDFVEISSYYGARRSVNGGPYNTYHEGTDFSAYRGSEVKAPAAAKVVLAEELAVRGGAVILDHGLGLHSGYYHLSAIHVRPGQSVEAGDLLGEVGSTGRSTGNHLHWDLLVGRTWVDPLTWLDQDLDNWLSPGLSEKQRRPNLAP